MAGTLGSPRPLYQAREMERNTNREPHRATPRSPRSALRHCLPQNVYIVTERFSDSAQDVHPRKPLKEIEVDLNHAIRSSIPYGPEVSSSESSSGKTSQDRGLLFSE